MFPLIALGQTAEDYFDKGGAKGKKEDWKGELINFNKAIELDPNLALAYYYKGVVKGELGDKRGAVQRSKLAIENAKVEISN